MHGEVWGIWAQVLTQHLSYLSLVVLLGWCPPSQALPSESSGPPTPRAPHFPWEKAASPHRVHTRPGALSVFGVMWLTDSQNPFL